MECHLRRIVSMAADREFRHVGGGPKGLFLALRYVFVIAAAYLLVFNRRTGPVAPGVALTIAGALASNVVLSFVSPRMLFAAWLAAPLLIADTLWVAWALHASGTIGTDFFLLYFFVLFLAAVGENPAMVVLGATVASAVNIYGGWSESSWTSPVLLRVVVIYAAALFYGHVLWRIRSERQRGDRTAEWARALEAKVAERTAELHGLYEASRAASIAKSEFMASMSHELRTPLHIIIGYSEMLLDGAATTPEEGIAIGRHIRSAATGFLGLVDEVLEISRLESAHVRIDPRPVRVSEFADELRHREWISPLPGVTLRWDLDPSPIEIETDPAKLEIVLANLVTNALKYTREGEVTVRVRARESAQRVYFEVDDTGPGIPENQLAHIREPFHESSGRGPHNLEGIGLGLAIVYRYAALLGAAVSVRSIVGRGTSFQVTVPFVRG
jgi:signal transduction histidine kinase